MLPMPMITSAWGTLAHVRVMLEPLVTVRLSCMAHTVVSRKMHMPGAAHLRRRSIM